MNYQIDIEWKDIPGYEGYYQVSNTGLVKSIKRTLVNSLGHLRNHPEKTLKPKIHNCGYHVVELSVNGKKKKYYVHRLVAVAFIENPEFKEQVNHLNGNKTDNTTINLCWATAKENSLHAHEIGIANRIPSTANCKAVYDPVANWYYSTIRDAAAKHNLKYSHLRSMLNGRYTNTTSLQYLTRQ